MKKIICFLIFILISFHGYAQLVVPQTNPAAGPLNSPGSWLSFPTGGNNTSIQENWGLNIGGNSNQPVRIFNSSLLVGYQGYSQDFGINNLLIAGNVGIGTTNPQGKLHIVGPLDGSVSALTIGDTSPGNLNVPIGTSTGAYNIDFNTWRDVIPNQVGARIKAERINNYAANSALVQSIDLAFYTSDGWNQSNLTEKLRIRSNGNVGVGTTSPDAKLTVNGTIHSKEVKVDLNVPGPDYVFEKNYKLKTLKEVQEYIAENKHLPEIPSAKVMEQNGVDLSEMNMQLLKKVEELTLYLIEKDKQFKEQKRQITQQEERLSKLEAIVKIQK